MATNNAINSNIPIQVALGGQGNVTLLNHGVLVGAATAAVTQLAVGSSGNLLIGSTGADPVFAAPTSTAGSLTYTTGAGTLNIDVASWADKTAWTPALSFGGGTTGITYTSRGGLYSRIGNVIMFQCSILLSNKGSSTGDMSISGLPVVSSGSSNYTCRISVGTLTWTGNLMAEVIAGASTITFYSAVTTGAQTALTNTNFANTTAILVSGHYFV